MSKKLQLNIQRY